MADKQLIKYSGEGYGDSYQIKNAVFSIKTAKNYTDLEKALTINFFSQLDVYDGTVAEQFKHFKRGYLQRALGQGIRYVETYGLLQTRKFKPASPGDKVCLEVPNNVNERAEVIGALTRVYCSSKEPDILDAYDLFVDPSEMFEFTKNKIGNIRQSISVFLDLTFQYILGIDPWGDAHADRFNSFTIGSILGAKWDDTAIGNFGSQTSDGVGALLKDIEEDLKKEIDKEKALPNVNAFNVWDWCPKFFAQNTPGASAEMKPADGTKPKKPTAKIDKAKLKKMYLDRAKADPNLSAVSICRCLSYHIQMMIGDVTAQNDSQFPGNMDKKYADYGKEKTTFNHNANPDQGSTKGAHTKSLFLPIRIPKEELVIIMNSDMFKEIKSAAMVSDSSEAGAYNNYIKSFMEFESNIVKIDTMPYGAFKIGSKLRYNQWDLYDKVETDKVGQHDVVVHTAHRGIAFGIREYRPFKYIRLNGVYANPTVTEQNIEFKEAKDL